MLVFFFFFLMILLRLSEKKSLFCQCVTIGNTHGMSVVKFVKPNGLSSRI